MQRLVVGGDRDARAAVEQGVEAARERASHDLRVPEGDRAGLDVDSLAEPDARAQVTQVVDVVERALEVGLQHDADVVVPGLRSGR